MASSINEAMYVGAGILSVAKWHYGTLLADVEAWVREDVAYKRRQAVSSLTRASLLSCAKALDRPVVFPPT